MDVNASQCICCLQTEQGGDVDGPRGTGRPVVAVLLAHLVIPAPLTRMQPLGCTVPVATMHTVMHLGLRATLSLAQGADPQVQQLWSG
jgi:hypothetical protein